jgi:hypothetical protein
LDSGYEQPDNNLSADSAYHDSNVSAPMSNSVVGRALKPKILSTPKNESASVPRAKGVDFRSTDGIVNPAPHYGRDDSGDCDCDGDSDCVCECDVDCVCDDDDDCTCYINGVDVDCVCDVNGDCNCDGDGVDADCDCEDGCEDDCDDNGDCEDCVCDCEVDASRRRSLGPFLGLVVRRGHC